MLFRAVFLKGFCVLVVAVVAVTTAGQTICLLLEIDFHIIMSKSQSSDFPFIKMTTKFECFVLFP